MPKLEVKPLGKSTTVVVCGLCHNAITDYEEGNEQGYLDSREIMKEHRERYHATTKKPKLLGDDEPEASGP